MSRPFFTPRISLEAAAISEQNARPIKRYTEINLNVTPQKFDEFPGFASVGFPRIARYPVDGRFCLGCYLQYCHLVGFVGFVGSEILSMRGCAHLECGCRH